MLVSQLTWKVVYGVLISFDLNLGVPCFELLGSLVSPLVEASQHTVLYEVLAHHALDNLLLVIDSPSQAVFLFDKLGNHV